MALNDILCNLQESESNANNSAFITLMKDIAGNPSDGISPEDDPASLYGQIVTMYNELVTLDLDASEIEGAIQTILNLTASAESVDPATPASAELVGNDIKIKVPRGATGPNGLDGLTPNIEFNYDAVTGLLTYSVVGYTAVEDVLIEEW